MPATKTLHPTEPSRARLLSRDEETTLIARAQSGDNAALEELVQCNEGLVRQIAGRYCNPVNYLYSDAVQDGTIGLLTAIRKFDTNSGLKLSTYATTWIRQAIGRGRESTEDLIRLPTHIKDQQAKLRRAIGRLSVQSDREPTVEELARETSLPVVKVIELLSLPVNFVSLDAPAGPEHNDSTCDATLLVDRIADPTPGPESDVRLEEFDLKQVVAGIFALMDPETADLLKRRFGFPPYDAPQSYEQIGNAVGMTRQGVHSRERRALFTLRKAMGITAGKQDFARDREERNRAIVQAVQGGEKVAKVALRFNMQVKRVREIVRQATDEK